MHGLLLFAHGARDPAWARPFESIAAQLRAAAPQCPVVLGFLELMQPGMVEAAQALAQAGATRITVVPLFLGSGGHIRRDMPVLLDEARAALPGVAIDATPAIGESDVVTRALAAAALTLAGIEPAA